MAAFTSPEDLATSVAAVSDSWDDAIWFVKEALSLLETKAAAEKEATMAAEAAAAASAAEEAKAKEGWDGHAITGRPAFCAYHFTKTPPPVRPRAKEEGTEANYPLVRLKVFWEAEIFFGGGGAKVHQPFISSLCWCSGRCGVPLA